MLKLATIIGNEMFKRKGIIGSIIGVRSVCYTLAVLEVVIKLFRLAGNILIK